MKRYGFTLVELLVALLVFSVGILGLAKMQTMTIQGNSYSNHFTQALNEANNQIERLSELPLTTAELSLGAHTTGINPVYQGVTYDVSWNVEAIPNSAARSVNVTISWQDKFSNPSIDVAFIKGVP